MRCEKWSNYLARAKPMANSFGNQDHGDDPTPSTIRQRCLEIQTTWTAADELLRRTGSMEAEPYEVPTLATPRGRLGERMG